jgi:hypothetical protein
MNFTRGSISSIIIFLIVLVVGIIGAVVLIASMNDYYGPITSGTVDVGNISSSGMYNQTFNLTRTLVQVGENFPFLLILIFFAVLLIGVLLVFPK